MRLGRSSSKWSIIPVKPLGVTLPFLYFLFRILQGFHHEATRFAYAISFILLSCAFHAPAVEAQSIKKARVIASELSGARRSYSYKTIADPTGQAQTRRVERFELREGICNNSDCERRPYTRSRIESQNITSLRNGDEAWLLFQVYFPSAEFNQVRHISATYGQLFVNYEYTKNWEGSAIWQLGSGPIDFRLVT
ncbi:MAG: hypothetical protein MK180_14395 [Rhodobacteraceae bacterium]|nr:hypothetical protein [Paracoccaceae bacterium]